MPSGLHLSPSTSGKVVMIAPPRINLRRTASYNDKNTAAVSSLSSRLNFNHLLFSPPPSPSLPALVPRPKRSASDTLFTHRPSRAIRTVFYFSALLVAFYLFASTFKHDHFITIVLSHTQKAEYEMVGQDDFPDFPTPVVVYDSKKQSKWTVSIPRNYEFPLSIQEYSGMNDLCREVSARARNHYHKAPISDQAWILIDQPDEYFVDVHEAEQSGLLSLIRKGQPPKHSGQFVGLTNDFKTGKPFCEKTLTYILESSNAGLGEAIMTTWTLYSLAKEQNRAFFIDDSRWAYGSYADIFKSPPIPSCRPPPRHQMLPCPAQTRHLVVSSVTLKAVLPALIANHQRRSGTDLGTKDFFDLAHAGYQSLFQLTKEDQTYVDKRIRDIRARAQYTKLPVDIPIIGFHIRHGDRHPYEFQYRESYIPSEVFARYGHNQVEAYFNKTSVKPEKYESIKVIASDDPMVHQEPEFSDAMLAQGRIRLATKGVVKAASPDPHYLHHSVDEAFGWEGGFYSAMFWNLGGKPMNNAVEDERKDSPSDEMFRLRSLVGRAYVMDLAILAGASDKVICAVSAMGCRLVAVMMGWERAMEHQDWINVDGRYEWQGLDQYI